MRPIEVLRIAWEAIGKNKVRALLTMLEDPEFASRWMLNVYDELVISSPAEIADQQSLVMKRAMEGVPLRVKLLTDAEQGHDWGDMIERADL